MSDDELKDEVARVGPQIAALQGRLALLAGEMERRRAWDADGASSLATWMVERNGISERTGRAFTELGERLYDLPHLARAFESGEVGLDKVAAVIALADPESDAEVTEAAKSCSVKELHQLARRGRGVDRGAAEAAHDMRHLRCNDATSSLSGKFDPESYALVKNSIDRVVSATDSDGETPLDQRRADALVRLCGAEGTHGSGGTGIPSSGANGHLVVIHVDLGDFKSTQSTAVAELERFGPIGAEVARRIACGADLIVAFDDELGHTMFEGRAQRYATDTQRREVWRRDRDCRFPGCGHTNFTIVHHIIHWEHGGVSDLSNLVLLCQYHHHMVHRLGWRVLGDANGELTFIGPDGRAMTSRPSPLWSKAKPKTKPGAPSSAELATPEAGTTEGAGGGRSGAD